MKHKRLNALIKSQKFFFLSQTVFLTHTEIRRGCCGRVSLVWKLLLFSLCCKKKKNWCRNSTEARFICTASKFSKSPAPLAPRPERSERAAVFPTSRASRNRARWDSLEAFPDVRALSYGSCHHMFHSKPKSYCVAYTRMHPLLKNLLNQLVADGVRRHFLVWERRHAASLSV